MAPEDPVQRLFAEALERADGPERAQFLEAACGVDLALKEKIEKLLRADGEAGSFFARPLRPAKPSRRNSDPPPTEKAGDRIGNYKLLEQIGEGGCGLVYMAEQEEPVRRRVALKVIKLGMDTRQVVARFEAERQALALMDHPNIARVLDGGATEMSRPYFVMELVRGIKITDFCDEQRLSPHERLELFMQVCSAVQHAHQKGIIHRDLKPSNILVAMVDGKATPKVIDFGVAKATTNQRLTDKTVFTALEQFIGTPAYMSPEQAELGGADIDTRTDVYSLGVVLYEMLTGRPPFDAEQMLKAGLDEIRRMVREEEPARPSTRLETLAAVDLTTVARARAMESPKLIHLVRGDLDWVVMKCLEKDRNRRYETASGLVADIRRHLENEPVSARPPSVGYRLAKMVRRNKLAFAAATLISMASIAVLVVSVRSAAQAHTAEQQQAILRLEAEAAHAESVRSEARAVHHLREALLSQAGALRKSGGLGQRYAALEALRQAALIAPGLDLRNEAAAALAKPDLKLESRWRVAVPPDFGFIGFSPDLELYAEGDPTGGFALRKTRDQSLVRRFLHPENSPGLRFVFSRDGRRIAAGFRDGSLEIWDQAGAGPLFRVPGANGGKELFDLVGSTVSFAAGDFHPDGNQVAIYAPGRGLLVRDLARGEDRWLHSSTEWALGIRYDPAGKRFAVNRAKTVEIWDAQTGAMSREISVGSGGPWSAWSPDGRWLLTCISATHELVGYDTTGDRPSTRFSSQLLSPFLFEFHPGGRWAVSTAYDHTLRLWDARTSQQLLVAPAFSSPLRWSQDGTRLAASPGRREACVYAFSPDTVFKEYFGATGGKGRTLYMSVGDDGRLVVSGSYFSVRLWDAESGTEVATLPSNLDYAVTSALLLPGGHELCYNLREGGVVTHDVDWTTSPSGARSSYVVSPATRLPGLTNASVIQMSADGRTWLLNRGGRCEVWERGTPGRMLLRVPTPWTRAALSPNGRFCATLDPGGDATIWEVETGNAAKVLAGYKLADPWFSPGGNWLIGSSPAGCRVWDTGSWSLRATWPPELAPAHSHRLAFGGDRYAAILMDPDTAEILTVPEGRELIRLEAPFFLAADAIGLSADLQRVWLMASGGRIFEWNLPALRAELARMGLDWAD